MNNIQHQFASYFNINVSSEDIESFEKQPNYEFIKKHITLNDMLTWYEDQVKQGQASNPYFQVMGDNAIERIESTFTARQKLTESQHLEMADLHAKNQNKFSIHRKHELENAFFNFQEAQWAEKNHYLSKEQLAVKEETFKQKFAQYVIEDLLPNQAMSIKQANANYYMKARKSESEKTEQKNMAVLGREGFIDLTQKQSSTKQKERNAAVLGREGFMNPYEPTKHERQLIEQQAKVDAARLVKQIEQGLEDNQFTSMESLLKRHAKYAAKIEKKQAAKDLEEKELKEYQELVAPTVEQAYNSVINNKFDTENSKELRDFFNTTRNAETFKLFGDLHMTTGEYRETKRPDEYNYYAPEITPAIHAMEDAHKTESIKAMFDGNENIVEAKHNAERAVFEHQMNLSLGNPSDEAWMQYRVKQFFHAQYADRIQELEQKYPAQTQNIKDQSKHGQEVDFEQLKQLKEKPLPVYGEKLLEFGKAPFKFENGAKQSYFVKTDKKTYWGAKLHDALQKSGAKANEYITIEKLARNEVVGHDGKPVANIATSWKIEKANVREQLKIHDNGNIEVLHVVDNQKATQHKIPPLTTESVAKSETKHNATQNVAQQQAPVQVASTPVAEQVKPAPQPEMPVYEGEKLIKHGSAPYLHDKKNKYSYFVETDKGTHWGVKLKQAMADSDAQTGDYIKVERAGKETVNTDDNNGNQITAQRNSWTVEVVEPPKQAMIPELPKLAPEVAKQVYESQFKKEPKQETQATQMLGREGFLDVSEKTKSSHEVKQQVKKPSELPDGHQALRDVIEQMRNKYTIQANTNESQKQRHKVRMR